MENVRPMAGVIALRPTAILLALLAGVGLALAGLGSATAQVGPDSWYFEIDGDDGDVLADQWQGEGEGYLPAFDVTLPDQSHTWGLRQSPCDNWVHTTFAPYMGPQSYRIHCEGLGPQRRTEQMLLSEWFPDSDDSQRYFSLAFRLVDVPEAPVPMTRGFVAQLHQGETSLPPFRMQWEYLCPTDSAECGYYLTMGVRWGDEPESSSTFDEFGPVIGDDRSGIPLTVGSWHRLLLRISLLSERQYAPGPTTGEVQAWLMDNATGQWVEFAYYTGRIGFRLDPVCQCQWKLGMYANNQDLVTVDYDNVAYGKRWNNITKNRLVGYRKTVLDLWCNEGSGSIVNDHSYSWNAGAPNDPVSDYDNDGTIQGAALWNADGVANGGSLRFNGSNYVSVPMDDVDFDFGNYCTASCWFRTTSHPPDNKGLVLLDEFSSNNKLKLYMSDTNLSFGIRYADGNAASLNYGFPAGTYADGEWHHALGTFNRFAPDGQRLKLYVDGQKVLQIPGSDLPMLKGQDQLVVGKFSVSGFFTGDIDEVLVRNYAMTEDEVGELYAYYRPGTGVGEAADVAPEPAAVAIRPNPSGPPITISFAVPRPARTTLSIFDLSGRLVARPFDDEVGAGQYDAVWDGRGRDGVHQPSGVYYYRLDRGGKTDSGSLVLIR